ncbi:xylulokinase [Pseudokineococcus lusitanus]|uniref:Xylulose kinase n=1 Tax=Pseudokineococcus lusitanus TaxID=763993 RepID=A0A3N1HQH1_9ACTN|nr:xylulokinase [Pseudokineococcus lusitanus]ROP44763.1 xylulokinase [Pseudokineococcus lusitanus]
MLVAGIDSSTQSCKVVVRDAATGALVRSGRAAHPAGTEVDPAAWWAALQEAVTDAGGLDDVEAVSVGAQQHGMVCLDADGRVVRPALLWNDTRSAQAAADLIRELGDGDEAAGRQAWAEQVGVVPVASFTVTKLRWLADAEPENAARTAAVALPHDWLTWMLAGGPAAGLEALATDRGDASGTGYFNARTNSYLPEVLRRALRRGPDEELPHLPRVLGPAESAGRGSADGPAPGVLLGAGTGDNAAAALGVQARPGDVVVSVGTSGVVSGPSDTAPVDPTGIVAGFADATGRQLPLVCTLNAARVLTATADLLGVDVGRLSDLALEGPSGAGGLVLVPYLEGERTPDRPGATGAVHGLTLSTSTPAHLARAAVEGLLCGLADGIDALVEQGTRVDRVVLVGGGARSEAVRRVAPVVLGRPVVVPPPGESVADGAARQAAWAATGAAEAPEWGDEALDGESVTYDAPEDPAPGRAVRARYAQVRDLTDA